MESVIATREEVQSFLSVNSISGSVNVIGSGNGTGYGFGNGSTGSGDGTGYGFGYGSGHGYNSGDGDGDGAGFRYSSDDGSGTGDGSGSGYGYGDGSGNGDDYGDWDIIALNDNIVDYVDDFPTIITQVRGNIARGYTVKSDLTLTPCFIVKIGNCFGHGKTIKEAVAYAEEKELKEMPVNERIEKFIMTFGSLGSEHTGKEFYDWHHILTGSCKFGRDEFCEGNNIKLDKKYTVRYFLDIVKNSYGRDVIRLLRKAYKIDE